MVPVSPLWDGREKSIMDIFVPIQLNRVAIEKNGSRGDTEQKVDTYKEMFYTDTTLIDRVSIQGDPGMGKTTFLSKFVLDWCDSDTSKDPNSRSNFSDVETLQDFRFVFHIKLRDSIGQSKVVEMIKTQIIDEIYFSEIQQVEAYDLLGRILERETCLVTMDGLNEWTDHTKENPIPKMYTLAKQCVVLVTSRPWKMADKRIRDSEIGTLLEVVRVTDPEQLTQNMLNFLTIDNKVACREFMAYVEERNLKHFLTSPWMLTLLVNLWVDKSFLSESLCEINKVLIGTLFNKGQVAKEEFEEPSPFEHSVFGHHTEIGNALARVAFKYTFGSEKSLVLSKQELLSTKMLSKKQLEFAIKSGVLNERICFSASSCKSHVSFLHETVQEFFAASYIANLPEDKTTDVFSKCNCNVLEVSQVIIYLSGLKWNVAYKAIQILTEKVIHDVNEGLDLLITGSLCPRTTLTFQKFVVNTKSKLNSEIDINMSSNLRGLVFTILEQNMMISCYHEAKVSKQKHIHLKMSDFTFHAYLNNEQKDDLLQMLIMNKSNVRTLLLERNLRHENTILTVLEQSKHCIERLKTSGSRVIISALQNLNLKQLTLIGNIDVALFSGLLQSFINLTFLRIEECDFNKDMFPPSSVQYLCLLKSRCSAEFVGRLLVHLTRVSHPVRLNLGEVYTTANDLYNETLRSRIASCDMSKLQLCFGKDVAQSFEILNATNLETIQFENSDGFLQASGRLHQINKIKTICLVGTYNGSFNARLPTMLQSIQLGYCKISHEWLCSLLITLSSFDHPVECALFDVVLQSSEETCVDDSHKNVSDLRYKILSHDFSNIELQIDNVSVELFEILRGTSIGILHLRTADCASLASAILHTLNKLKRLDLWGTYTGRCDLKLPASLQYISLQVCECSSEWLCSLLITLSSLDHPVKCELWTIVLQTSNDTSGEESHLDLSDLKTEMMSYNMSNMQIFVNDGSKDLFEILRGTSIGILNLITAECASLASAILHTLNKLKKLYLSGTYTGRLDLKLPTSLQCIGMERIECSSEWLCSLLIMLTSLDYHVKCELWDVVFHLSEETIIYESHSHVSGVQSDILSHDMSNVEILVKTGSKRLFEILRDTSIRILELRTADCASLASAILHTLNKLKRLDLWGTYTGRCDLKLPASLQYISLQVCECSSEWLCSLLMTLSSLDHPVKCELWTIVLQTSNDTSGEESHLDLSDLKTEMMSYNMSNMQIFVNDGSKDLFEILRGTSIGILNLRTAECASLASAILHTLNKLKKLYLSGTYTGQLDLKLPTSLQCISMERIECSSEWLCSLLIMLTSLDHHVKCELWDVVLHLSEETIGYESHSHVSGVQSDILSHDMSNVLIYVKTGSKELFEILRDTSIRILDLRTADCASLASEMLHTLNRLTTLYLRGAYTNQCNLRLPASMQCIILQESKCSSEWLCSLLITLSSLDHPVKCVLWNVVLLSSEETRGGVSLSHVSDLRSEILSRDLSNVEIIVKTGSKGLFEMLRDTSIGILNLRTAACASLASEMLHTLNKLTKLYLCGNYTGRCNIKLPTSMQYIILKENECSSEWLCRLLITLSSLEHTVKCVLLDIVLHASEENRGYEFNSYVSDLRSKILSHDMSNVEIYVKTGSKELFDILRDTRVGILGLISADCASLASEILHMLNKLSKLYLLGTYTGRCDLKLPTSLQCISMKNVECSSEWLCSLLITLSSLDHPVKCVLWNVVLLSSEETRGELSLSHVSDLRSEILSRDLSNVEIFVKTDSKRLFEILRDTSIRILDLGTADCASLASEMLHTLNRLTTLCLRGAYTSQCNLRLPASMQCIILQESKCSSEWLCSLLITLSSLDHPVKCVLWNVVLLSSEETRGDVSLSHVSDLRSEILSRDLSNVEILVKTGSQGLFEMLRDTSIGILNLQTAECASLASEMLHTLNKLSKLYLFGTYTGRCDLTLPTSLQCISMIKVECSSEWLCCLLIMLTSLDHHVKCELWDVVLHESEENRRDKSQTHISDLRSEMLSRDLSNVEILVKTGSKGLFEMLRDTSIRILNLRTADCVSLASEMLHTLNKLTMFYLCGNYTGRCNIRLPTSMQYIILNENEYSSEWLCSLLITLSSLEHTVKCVLLDIVLHASEENRVYELNSYVSDLRSKNLSHDMSNVEIYVKTGSKELFEILRDTRVEILGLISADCASLASEILHMLNKLTKLYVFGTYTGRLDLKLPTSLQCICMKNVECSSEWLCSLLITLSSLDHPVKCVLWNVVLLSSEETCGDLSLSHVSDLRSEILSRDLSNVEIFVKTGSKRLFEILRDTSIRILDLGTADCASLASEKLHTLNRLTTLCLRGAYTSQFNLRLPASMQCIILRESKCSSEWLCSLLITLSSLDHPVKCVLWNVVLLSSEETRGDVSLSHVSDLQSEILSRDLSNVEILVNTGSQGLFEILRDTSIGILNLQTAECASLASEMLHTLNKLSKLYLYGTYTGRCDLTLPTSLQCISMIKVECSSEWLCCLLIMLTSLDHHVKCELWDVVLHESEENRRDKSQTHISDLRSEILSRDMSNIKLLINKVSAELLETLHDTNIEILHFSEHCVHILWR